MTQRIVFSLFLFIMAAVSASATTAVDDFFLSVEDQPVEIPFSILLDNDDFDSRIRWQVVLDQSPADGDLTTGLEGFVYEPRPGFVGLDTLTYHLQSAAGSSSNVATVRIHVSPLRAPVAGDWDGDGDIELGVYKNAPAPYFYLCKRMEERPDCPKYPVPAAFLGYLPIAGNWDDDPADEVGLYSPITGRFYLRDYGPNLTLPALTNFKLGQGGKGNLPLAGDWTNSGRDTVGVRIATSGKFGLRDTNSNDAYDHFFEMTGSHPDWLPFAVDWRQDGSFGVGLYDQVTRRVYLRDDLTDGPPQEEFVVFLYDDTLVPVSGADDPGSTDFTYFFFSRASGIFHLYPNWGNPAIKIVIPTDPDDP